MTLSWDSALSLYAIPAAWITLWYPHAMKYRALSRTAGYNNVNARTNIARIRDNKKVAPEVAARIARMEAAHLNGHETFPLWAAAVLAGNFAGLDNSTLNTIAVAFIASRVVYNYIYINNTTEPMSGVRTLVWLSGIVMSFTLLIKAGNKLSSA